ncbi:CPCC family cysteine-rich protein [Roseibium sp. SCPC15]|uniref:CPCC family cysteine-rich protein n=1 Tax=Roseibium sp. SCP15 TaxID=3141376 RepID=UPI00333E00F9
MNDQVACKCCGYYTIGPEGDFSYEICPVCFWEADPVQNADPDYAGGVNVPSLNEAKKTFAATGASELRFLKNVRKPHFTEFPENN